MFLEKITYEEESQGSGKAEPVPRPAAAIGR